LLTVALRCLNEERHIQYISTSYLQLKQEKSDFHIHISTRNKNEFCIELFVSYTYISSVHTVIHIALQNFSTFMARAQFIYEKEYSEKEI
jgi:hypothetical protein